VLEAASSEESVDAALYLLEENTGFQQGAIIGQRTIKVNALKNPLLLRDVLV
jgi:hypothetical protein